MNRWAFRVQRFEVDQSTSEGEQTMQQLALFDDGQPDLWRDHWVTGLAADRKGAAVYVHLIRDPTDPERMPRGSHGGDPNERWRKLTGKGTEPRWRSAILDHLADGQARTFNRLMVELADITADVALEKAPDRALWSLVETGQLEHNLTAPVRFRVRQKEQNR